MKRIATLIAATAVLGACNYVSKYEEAVYDYEPVYCYKTLAGIQCFDTPNQRDERRLVNYFGPHPSRYERKWQKPERHLAPPPPIDYFVRDADPIPQPAPAKGVEPLPWQEQKASTAAPEAAAPETRGAEEAQAPAELAPQAAEEDPWLQSVKNAVSDSE